MGIFRIFSIILQNEIFIFRLPQQKNNGKNKKQELLKHSGIFTTV